MVDYVGLTVFLGTGSFFFSVFLALPVCRLSYGPLIDFLLNYRVCISLIGEWKIIWWDGLIVSHG